MMKPPLRRAQSEVDSKIVLRQIARSGLNVPDENLPADEKFQAGANAVTIALRPDGTNNNGVGAIAPVIAEQIGG